MGNTTPTNKTSVYMQTNSGYDPVVFEGKIEECRNFIGGYFYRMGCRYFYSEKDGKFLFSHGEVTLYTKVDIHLAIKEGEN